MNKTKGDEIKELMSLLEKERQDRRVAENNVKMMKAMAEKSGSEVAVWKHEALRSRDIIRQLENENKMFKESRLKK
jgi:hypothetical protein